MAGKSSRPAAYSYHAIPGMSRYEQHRIISGGRLVFEFDDEDLLCSIVLMNGNLDRKSLANC